ncbi:MULTISPECIES: L,D-transpeptidase family protein [Streptomyces]|uniref:Lipoprotein n=1 Tax=Streptomyces xanthochromogenes TaxID=67384 RepID=A0ABQ3A5C3_9ACTN|nr:MULTISPECIES: L,D-transpeptidase family protein [Streptomyces]MYV89531.1 L,D-transpeptidase family protein [Streptomyces sp. SID1034]GGY32861.1 lipoprotein [Streptomyces xanthochromogenes]
MRRNQRTTLIARTLAATAVIAVAVGCGPQGGKADAGAPATPAPPSSSTPAKGTPSPAGSASTDDKPSGSPAAPRASASPAAKPAPKPAAKVLMSTGSKGAQVKELQARLAQIGWFDDTPTGTYGAATTAAVKGFQGKRGLPATGSTDTVTWEKLLGMTTRPTADELAGRAVNKPTAKLDPRCMTGRAICISKTSRTLSWVVDGKVQSTMDVRFGSQYTPTREGVFKVFEKSRDHVSTIYHTAMPFAMFFSGGQAVHYSSDFAARGYNGASHGCVNVRDKAKVSALFDQVHIGDKVVVYW